MYASNSLTCHLKIFPIILVSQISLKRKFWKMSGFSKVWFHLHEKVWDCQRRFICCRWYSQEINSFCWNLVKCFLFYPLALCPLISWMSATPSIFQVHSSFLKVVILVLLLLWRVCKLKHTNCCRAHLLFPATSHF